MNLLLIEDDLEAAKFLQKGLAESGYAVSLAVDGRDGLRQAQEQAFDLLITDRMLPHLDGLALVRALREQGVRTPVLVLSALGTVDDRVLGLKAGGDDYLTKPFAFSELLARVEALLRRSAAEKNVPQTRIRVADLEMDLLSRSVTRAGKEIQLTAREFKLLEFLMRHADQVVTRTMLLEGVWDLQFDPQTNLIDVHMSRLRQAVDKGFARLLIHTVRGAGYVIRDEDKSA
jgi:two-component system OmpR family response regulator